MRCTRIIRFLAKLVEKYTNIRNQEHSTWVSTLACSTSVRASAINPLIAHPICSSISIIFSTLLGSWNIKLGNEKRTSNKWWLQKIATSNCKHKQMSSYHFIYIQTFPYCHITSQKQFFTTNAKLHSNWKPYIKLDSWTQTVQKLINM